MLIRKGICPNCGSRKNFKESIFDVNMDTDFIYCPYCGKKLRPYDATNKFNDVVVNKLNKSAYHLYVKGNTSQSYFEYGVILSVDENNFEARYGRILSLLYSSTMRKSYIDDAISLFEKEYSEFFHEAKDKQGYLNFLSKANFAVDEYIARIKNSLTIKKCFYDSECLKLYLLHLCEVIKFQKLLLNEALFLSKHFKNQKTETLIAFLNRDIEEREKLLNTPFRIVDGNLLKLHAIKKNKEIVLENCHNNINTHLSKFKLASLDESDKNKKYIKDNLFKNNSLKIAMCNLLFVATIIFFITAIILLMIAFMKFNNDIFTYLYLSIGILSSLLFIGSLIGFFYLLKFINKMKKRIF